MRSCVLLQVTRVQIQVATVNVLGTQLGKCCLTAKLFSFAHQFLWIFVQMTVLRDKALERSQFV